MIFVDRVWLLPTVTLPKLRVVGLADKVPCETPVPESGIVKLGFDAFEVIVTAPVALPAVVGVNMTLKLALAPALNDTGAVMPLTLKPDPLTATLEIVTVVPPVFVIFSVSD